MSGCYVADCDGCRCSTSPMPPCGHCEGHSFDRTICDRCGCDECGCTEEREELRERAAVYPELMP